MAWWVGRSVRVITFMFVRGLSLFNLQHLFTFYTFSTQRIANIICITGNPLFQRHPDIFVNLQAYILSAMKDP